VVIFITSTIWLPNLMVNSLSWAFRSLTRNGLMRTDTKPRPWLMRRGLHITHRLPAMRSVFKPLMKALITEMLKREVWRHWYLTSQPGTFVDPDLKRLRKPWVDPVCRGNIMVCARFMFHRRLSPLTNVSTLGIYFW